MRLSVRLSSNLPSATLLACAKAAKEVGVDRCWLSDNPYERSALITATAIGTSVPGLDVGVGTANARARHPVVLAQDAAAAASYLQDRLALGFGLGFEPQRVAMSLPRRSGLEILRESVLTVRSLLNGEEVRLSDAPDAQPISLAIEPHALPLLVGAVGPKTLALTGEVADGVIYSMGTTVPYLQEATRIALAAREAAGLPASSFDTVAYAIYGGNVSEQEAAERLRPVAGLFVREVLSTPGLLRMFQGCGYEQDQLEAMGRQLDEGADVANVIPMDLVNAITIWGDAERCAERLAAYEAAGVTEVALGLGGWCRGLPDVVADVEEIIKHRGAT
jgi:5,10-methylenetetrahydromethanopterin reductase